jgi:hypothetical protein
MAPRGAWLPAGKTPSPGGIRHAAFIIVAFNARATLGGDLESGTCGR